MSVWEQFSGQMVHHPTSPVMFVSLSTGKSLIIGCEEGIYSLASRSPDLTL